MSAPRILASGDDVQEEHETRWCERVAVHDDAMGLIARESTRQGGEVVGSVGNA